MESLQENIAKCANCEGEQNVSLANVIVSDTGTELDIFLCTKCFEGDQFGDEESN